MPWFVKEEHPKIAALQSELSATEAKCAILTQENIRLYERIKLLEGMLDRQHASSTEDFHRIVDHILEDAGRRRMFSPTPPPDETKHPETSYYNTPARRQSRVQDFARKHTVRSAIEDNLGIQVKTAYDDPESTQRDGPGRGPEASGVDVDENNAGAR